MESPSTATARAPSSRLRAGLRLAALLGLLALCVPPHLIARAFGRSRWPQRFLRGVTRLAGVDVRCVGRPVEPATLLLANHVSWLDIPIMAGFTGCAFVSKAEVQDHPFLQWIADQNDTVYIDRSSKRSIHGQVASLAEGLKRGRPLALFPEGTVSDGTRLLPFKASLLAAVTPAPDDIAIRAVALDYGPAAPDIGWGTGEPGLDNFLRVLGRNGRMAVTVHLLDPLSHDSDRKALARAAEQAIGDALAASGTLPARV